MCPDTRLLPRKVLHTNGFRLSVHFYIILPATLGAQMLAWTRSIPAICLSPCARRIVTIRHRTSRRTRAHGSSCDTGEVAHVNAWIPPSPLPPPSGWRVPAPGTPSAGLQAVAPAAPRLAPCGRHTPALRVAPDTTCRARFRRAAVPARAGTRRAPTPHGPGPRAWHRSRSDDAAPCPPRSPGGPRCPGSAGPPQGGE